MRTIEALQGGARTWLVHTFGNGLDGEDRFVVERFKALIDGDIRPIQPEAPRTKGRRRAKRVVVSRQQAEAMRPARTEIIICTGLRTKGGRQYRGDIATSMFHDRRQRAERRSPGRPAGGKPTGAPAVRSPNTPGGRCGISRPGGTKAEGPRALPPAGCRTARRRPCVKCGRCRPVPGRPICGACAEKANAAGRARDARLRSAGQPRRYPNRAREYERERSRREAEQRRGARPGCAEKCGRNPTEPGRRTCEPRLAKKREADRIRYRKTKDAGLKYGGKPVAIKRKAARIASKRRQNIRRASGLCTGCGRRPARRGRRDLRALPHRATRGRPRALRRPEVRRVVREVRRPGERRRLPVRTVFGARIRGPFRRTKERGGPSAVPGPENGRALYGLQCAEPGNGEVRALCPPIA